EEVERAPPDAAIGALVPVPHPERVGRRVGRKAHALGEQRRELEVPLVVRALQVEQALGGALDRARPLGLGQGEHIERCGCDPDEREAAALDDLEIEAAERILVAQQVGRVGARQMHAVAHLRRLMRARGRAEERMGPVSGVGARLPRDRRQIVDRMIVGGTDPIGHVEPDRDQLLARVDSRIAGTQRYLLTIFSMRYLTLPLESYTGLIQASAKNARITCWAESYTPAPPP